jgi:hypothetical protein
MSSSSSKHREDEGVENENGEEEQSRAIAGFSRFTEVSATSLCSQQLESPDARQHNLNVCFIAIALHGHTVTLLRAYVQLAFLFLV